LTDKLEIYDRPKHGNLPDLAASELSVLDRQCFAQRVSDRAALEAGLVAWWVLGNAATGDIDKRFTTENARVKFQRLDP
jgi:hypothetical protein